MVVQHSRVEPHTHTQTHTLTHSLTHTHNHREILHFEYHNSLFALSGALPEQHVERPTCMHMDVQSLHVIV